MRKSNLEMLRIISMLLIVMSHCDGIFGLSQLYSESIGIYKVVTEAFSLGGQIGVGCFILISGYFMVDKKISVNKILKLAGEVWFYTIGIWFLWMICNVIQKQIDLSVCFKEACYAFFPVILGHYWFVTAYIILIMLSPFLNKLIYSLDYQNYQKFLLTLLLIFVVLGGGIPGLLSGIFSGRLLPVCIIYFIAGYIKRFGISEERNSAECFLIAFCGYVLLFISDYLMTFWGVKLNSQTILNNRYFYTKLNSPVVIFVCIQLFTGFLQLNLKDSKVINTVAGGTFGVYLLHSNRILSGYLTKMFPLYREDNPLLIFIYSLGGGGDYFQYMCPD